MRVLNSMDSNKNTNVEDVPLDDMDIGDRQDISAKTPSVFNLNTIKNRQRYLLWGIGTLVMGGIVAYGWISMENTTFKSKQEFKSSLLTGSSRINPQEAWVYQFRTEAEITKKRLDTMEDMLSKILKLNEVQKSSQGHSSAKNSNDPAALIESVREDLKTASLDSEPALRAKDNLSLTTSTHSGSFLPPPPASSIAQSMGMKTEFSNLEGGLNASHPFRSKTVRKISLSLKNSRNNTPLKTVDNTIPAGAFAKAVLLGGVDASASIQASSDPRPALLRIMDPGTLPRKFHSDLKGCHALAACYGDVSSERVFMRLEKLTCTERKTGEIVEVKVHGYVAGEDGRTGVRGSVVDRAGESMRNALMGGFLSGLGEFLSQSHNPVTFSPISGLAQGTPMGMKDMLKAGAGKGVNNALDKYADFYIKRAEQVQPVIQVAAGRQVDIVFTEGISLEESLYRKTLGKSNDQGRYHQIQTMNEGSQDTSAQRPVSDWVKGKDPNHE